MQDGKRIVAFGSSRCTEGDEVWSLAYAVGRILGSRGLSVASGGYEGTMGAVSRGVHETGGRVVGITTTVFAERRANRFLHEELVETTYQARMAALLAAGDGYVALPGALGTLSEWLAAWCLASIGELAGPLWVFEHPWRPVAEAALAVPEIRREQADVLRWVKDPQDLGAQLDEWLGRSGSRVV
jgi:uncharacterized protein (TIGR00730 family)